MNLETKITIYKFTPQLFTLTPPTFTVAVSAANAFTLALKNCAATRWGLPHKASRQSIKVMMCLFFMVVILWKPTPEYSG